MSVTNPTKREIEIEIVVIKWMFSFLFYSLVFLYIFYFEVKGKAGLYCNSRFSLSLYTPGTAKWLVTLIKHWWNSWKPLTARIRGLLKLFVFSELVCLPAQTRPQMNPLKPFCQAYGLSGLLPAGGAVWLKNLHNMASRAAQWRCLGIKK